MTNSEIIKKFYEDNYRAPTHAEFLELGGKHITSSEYSKLIKRLGYEPSRKCKVYQVLDDRGQVIFEGLSKEVAKKFNISKVHVWRCASKGHKIKWIYSVRKRGE